MTEKVPAPEILPPVISAPAIAVPEKVAEPQPLPTTNVDELEMLKAQIDRMEKMQSVPEEIKVSEVSEEPSKEDLERFRQLQTEIERLQNDGVWRVEMLYQLNRIATALEK